MARLDPDWPRLMKRSTAMRYLDMSGAEFDRAVTIGELPLPVNSRWSRAMIDEHVERLFGERAPDWRAKRAAA